MGKEKKEIGKLIELLNEYEQLNMCRKFDSFELHTFENSSGVDRLLEDTVISRRYGFIGWLVENDKIDFEGMSGHADIIRYLRDVKKCGWEQIKEGVVLMLLAISQNPISDLISYLK